jgi:hypothetical protein
MQEIKTALQLFFCNKRISLENIVLLRTAR